MLVSILFIATAGLAEAHLAAWAPGMYCRNGTDGVDNSNNNLPVGPLYDLPRDQWWFQANRGCDKSPPADGEFLEIPAGGSFTVEIATNRAFTTLSYDGSKTNEWPDGGEHPDDWHGEWDGAECVPDGGFMHTQNQSMAAGTAWAISYESDLARVTMESLVVFSVLEHTPWKRVATYEAPSGLPACPSGGCNCAWLWVPNGCGQANIYMQPYKCNVTGATSAKSLAKAKPPVMCENDTPKCAKGAKQVIIWNQQSGNNIDVENGASPAYSKKCGWKSGAQDDIFTTD